MNKNELKKLRKQQERIERKERNRARLEDVLKNQKSYKLNKKVNSQKDAEDFKKELLKIKKEKEDVDRGALK